MLSLEAHERERTGIKSLKVGFNKVFGYYIEVRNTTLEAGAIGLYAQADAGQWRTLYHARTEGTRGAYPERDGAYRGAGAKYLRRCVAAIEYFLRAAYDDSSAIAKLDVLLSLAEVAAHQGYVRPQLEQGAGLEIVGGRHPVVEYALDGDVFIPNDTSLGADEAARIVLLTGPNMAGKSTYLRQVALIRLLAQIG